MDLQVRDVTKSFDGGARHVDVLTGARLSMQPGQAVAVMGPSGCGKSTLLHIVGTLDEPTTGTVTIGGQDPFALPEPELARFRNRSIGFVFQDHHLLPQYTVLENALLPAQAYPREAGGAEDRVRDLLERVGLGHRLDHRPAELSGGERQRVALARALVNAPGLVLCDEPTGNLDEGTADAVAELLLELHRDENNILIVVTHSRELAERFEWQLRLRNGQLVEPKSRVAAG